MAYNQNIKISLFKYIFLNDVVNCCLYKYTGAARDRKAQKCLIQENQREFEGNPKKIVIKHWFV
jgi:hypothetical protein